MVACSLAVTLTPAEVVKFPATSRARAVSVWAPRATLVVSQVIAKGGVVSSGPIATPSTRNVTPASARSSDASAESATGVPDVNVSPLTGEVIVTVGGAKSLLVVTVIVGDWPR